MILQGYIVTYLYLGLIIFSSFISNKLNVKTIIIRKLTHIMLSLLWIIMFYFFGNSYHLLIPPISFVIMNYILYKKELFKLFLSSGEYIGIVYYSVSIFVLAAITYFYPPFYPAYGIGILCLGLGDGFAPLVAGFLKSRKLINDKTLVGSLTVFLMSSLVVVIFNYFALTDYNIIEIVIIGFSSSLLELYSSGKFDNLSLPMGVACISFLLGVI